MFASAALLFLRYAAAQEFFLSVPQMVEANDPAVTFHCIGACDKPKTVPSGPGGTAMMGGMMYPGVTIDSDYDVYAWLLNRSFGGDVLVLTASDAPCDVYNDLIYNLPGTTHLQPNSVTTACFTGRSGSYDKRLKQLLYGASMIFITGGDQNKYYNYWRDSPVSTALAQLTRPASQGGMGRPLGGSSAGLAVQGEYCYVADHGPFDSPSALQDPLQMDLAPSFLDLATPWMKHIITDTHFMQLDRMGRLVAFLGVAVSQEWIHEGQQIRGVPGAMGIGVSEHTAVLLDVETGIATLAGVGPAYFLTTQTASPSRCKSDEPLEFEKVSTWRWNSSDGPANFDFGSWQPTSNSTGKRYSLAASNGNITSTGNHGAIY